MMPVVEDRHAAAELLDLLHVVGGVDHGGARLVHGADAREDLGAALGVHGHGRLVKEREVGPMGDAAGDVEAPQQAARQLAGAPRGELPEAAEVHGGVHAAGALGAVRHVEAAEEVDVLAYRELVEDGDVLGHHAHAALEAVARGGHGLAEELDPPLVVGEQLQDAVDGSGLAAAVGAEEPEDLPRPDGEREVVDGHEGAVALHEVLHRHGGRRRRGCVHDGSSRWVWVPKRGHSMARRPPEAEVTSVTGFVFAAR